MIGELLQLQVVKTHQHQIFHHLQILVATIGEAHQVVVAMIGEVPGPLELLAQAKTTGKKTKQGKGNNSCSHHF